LSCNEFQSAFKVKIIKEHFDNINHFFLISQMIVLGSSYWNIGIGRKEDDEEDDEERLKTMEGWGKNMAWLLKKINRA
jgi:multimeric flavodoxin WrbA